MAPPMKIFIRRGSSTPWAGRGLWFVFGALFHLPFDSMTDLALIIPPNAAAGNSSLFLLLGGGLGCAVVISFPAKLHCN